jgi:hypothetical protein
MKTPYKLCYGRKLVLSHLRTCGYRLNEPPRPHQIAKSEIHARTGIILGYAQTLKNLLYFDLDSHNVKSDQHACYDEGMNDVADPPPTARLILFAHEPFPAKAALLDASVSATVAALDETYTDAETIETICRICGDMMLALMNWSITKLRPTNH